MDRRRFLRGLGGAVLALPFLETFAPKRAKASGGGYPAFAVFVRQANGCVQKVDDEPEMFFPTQLGPLVKEDLAAQTDRTVSVLSDYADKLIVVRGVNYAFANDGCGHARGGNQCLTAAKYTAMPSDNQSRAMGESIDNRIARELQPAGVEPLTLYAGKMVGYIDEVLSYRGPMQLRAAERNPFVAYTKLFGLSNVDPRVLTQLKTARTSVNDLVRHEMTSLMSRNDLSKADKDRLDLHFQSIRDLETTMSCKLTDMAVQAMSAAASTLNTSDAVIPVTRMQMDIIALAFACGVARTATLQIGDGNDSTEYVINGVKQYSYHWISHRIQSDSATGTPIPDAYLLHHEIDKIHAAQFKYLLDKLSSYTLVQGTLLDSGVAVWTNDLATKYHDGKNLPFVLAGGCNGFLKTGQYIDAGNVTNNKMWNTVGSAVGCRKNGPNSGYMDDFGDPSLKPGFIDAMMA